MSVDEDAYQHVLDGYPLNMAKLRAEIESTMSQEKENLEQYDPMFNEPDMHNCKGWVEALKYVLGQIENFKGGSA
tara:strand:+ start:460 stop:684 length:225 start_codon:yes stop_codon:yes gene_type:complete